jgi:transcriptional regulator with XRE-family HTH domain
MNARDGGATAQGPPAFAGEPRLAEVRAALGRRIVRRRRQRDWRQQELASLLGVTVVRLSQMENGHVSPTLVELLRLRAVLGLSLEELVVGEAPEGTTSPLLLAAGHGRAGGDGQAEV